MRAKRLAGAGLVVLAGCVGLSACSSTTEGKPSQASGSTSASGNPSASESPTPPPKGPRVDSSALKKMVIAKLGESNMTPQSVDCQQDLIGQIGQTAICDVTITPVNSFELTITVTGVNRGDINYQMVPSVNKAQLEASVADMILRSTKTAADSVSCESGLEGKVGAIAFCNVTTAGATNRQAVAVTAVVGLSMTYGLAQPSNAPAPGPGAGNTPAGQTLPKAVAEGALIAQLKHNGGNPDSATCAGDLAVSVGATLPCTAVTAGQPQNYILTVAAIVNGNITFKVAPAP